MKKQKGMVFFRKQNDVNDIVYYIGKDGSFMGISNVYEKIDQTIVRNHIMKNAKHITSNYSNRVIAPELLRKDVAKSVIWLSDEYFMKKKNLNFEFISV